MALALAPSRWQTSLSVRPEDATRTMSLDWTIDAEAQLVVIVADGDFARRDVETLLDDLASSGAMAYRKLFDGSRGDTSMSSEDLLMLGVRFRAIHARERMGPLPSHTTRRAGRFSTTFQ